MTAEKLLVALSAAVYWRSAPLQSPAAASFSATQANGYAAANGGAVAVAVALAGVGVAAGAGPVEHPANSSPDKIPAPSRPRALLFHLFMAVASSRRPRLGGWTPVLSSRTFPLTSGAGTRERGLGTDLSAAARPAPVTLAASASNRQAPLRSRF